MVAVFIKVFVKNLSCIVNFQKTSSDPDMSKKIIKFYCYKLKLCTPKNEKLCGYDETSQVLRYFEDKCDMYKVNCHGEGYFVVSKMEACDAKKEFEEKYGNGSIQFEHVPNPDSPEFDVNTEEFTQTRSTVQYQSPSIFWSYTSTSITDWAFDWPVTQSSDTTKLIRRKEIDSQVYTIEDELPSTSEKPIKVYETINQKFTTKDERNTNPEYTSNDEVSTLPIELDKTLVNMATNSRDVAATAVDMATILNVNVEKER